MFMQRVSVSDLQLHINVNHLHLFEIYTPFTCPLKTYMHNISYVIKGDETRLKITTNL